MFDENYDGLVNLAEYRQAMFRREASRQRALQLARAARRSRPGMRPVHYVLLDRLGTRLIAWGQHIKTTYGPAAEPKRPSAEYCETPARSAT